MESNFKESILNLSATLANYIGVKSDVSRLSDVEEKLNRNARNVVFIIFDGLGVYNVKEFTKNKKSFYKEHIYRVIKSTIPATTTNATTTLLSTKYPDEHLWLAWSLYLKEQKKVSEIYLNRDYYTNLPILPYVGGDIEAFVDKAKTSRKIFAIAPTYVKNFKKIDKKDADSIEELFIELQDIIDNGKENFVYCYCDDPDKTMHSYGIKSRESKERFIEIEKGLEKIINNNKDIMIITTADHGHIDTSHYIELYKDEEIMSLLERPLSMETRFVSFKIKNDMVKTFEKIFKKKYGKYLDLYKSEEVINSGIFGRGKNKKIIKELLGDFVAVGNNSFYGVAFGDMSSRLKGNHAGYTKEEMEVPVCIFEN